MDKQKYITIKNKYGKKASFAIWAKIDEKDKKRVDDISIFESSNICDNIKENIIFVGMNLASDAINGMKDFSNFHSGNTKHNDYRLRDAITGTAFEGAYMTDLFSKMASSSAEVKDCYKDNPMLVKTEIDKFIEECRDLTSDRKIVICIGTGFHYKELIKYFKTNKLDDFLFEFSKPENYKKPMFYIPHYSGIAGKTDVAYNRESKALLEQIRADCNL